MTEPEAEPRLPPAQREKVQLGARWGQLSSPQVLCARGAAHLQKRGLLASCHCLSHWAQ